MNKLRTFSLSAAVFLQLLAVWGALYYGPSVGYASFIPVALVGLLIPAIPPVLAWLAFHARRLWPNRGKKPAFSFERGSMFVSTDSVSDPERVLGRIREAVTGDERFDAVTDDRFSEGAGLTVGHAGFHNSFVRFSEGRLVVTGASERTHALADLVADACSLSFERARNHPFKTPAPIRGAPRAFLGLFLVVLLLVGASGFATVAYSGSAYNTAEKAVLVGFDAREEFVPGVTPDETRLDKAAFLVDGLAEEAVEIRWERNSTERILAHGRQSVSISNDVRQLLSAARDDGLDPDEAARADRIETELHDAERSVATAIDERASNESVRDERLVAIRDRLLEAAETPA